MVTPQQNHPDLARAVGILSLFLKREDMHPYGSHKGRSIPVMIDRYIGKGKRHFAISSSGNAALAAALHVKKLNESGTERVQLEILIGNKIPERKFNRLTDLTDFNVTVMRFERPLQALTQKTADGSIQSLRQSTDDVALIGYESLAQELDEIQDLRAIFVATSSGTTAQALADYFLKKQTSKGEKEREGKTVEVHIVQTTSCHPMALGFVDSVPSETASIADAIVDITAHRKNALTGLIQKTGGSGWIASNEEIKTAQELIEKHAGIKASPNGALSLVGLIQAAFTGREWNGSVVCIVGGE